MKVNMSKYTIGIDFGTNSVRGVLYSCENGQEFCTSVFNYPTGEDGVCIKPDESLSARQNPKDYIDGLKFILKDLLKLAQQKKTSFISSDILGVGIGATGSTPLPVDKNNMPLSFQPEFKDNLDAYAWLWKDHSSVEEATAITNLARENKINYVSFCGNSYSSEWFWAKILHCLHVSPRVFEQAYSWVELADYIPSILSGVKQPDLIKRGACAAGHKAMFHTTWGGLPDDKFLNQLSPELPKLRQKLFTKVYAADQTAGLLSAEWSKMTGLPEGIPIAIGLLDAHYGAIGSGIQEGTLVKILGTSTCDCVVVKNDVVLPAIEGISGVAEESILPGYYGLEAGQSAVGDIFKWYKEKICGTEISYLELEDQASQLKPGQSGLMALDWNNGCRNIYCDHELTGLLLGQTLNTSKPEIYRALIEATGFGAKLILERLQKYQIKIDKIVCCGGLSQKNKLLVQIYADIFNCDVAINTTEQTCALGGAIAAAVCAGKKNGGYNNFKEAIASMVPSSPLTYKPIKENSKIYNDLYQIYKEVAEGFAGKKDISLNQVMKKLISLK
jgi:L-ribulokinase